MSYGISSFGEVEYAGVDIEDNGVLEVPTTNVEELCVSTCSPTPI